jgi:hypothetical protein
MTNDSYFSMTLCSGAARLGKNPTHLFCSMADGVDLVRTIAVGETLIYSAFPAAQGCATEIDDGKSLISKQGENRIFAAARAPLIEQASQDGFFQRFLGANGQRQFTCPLGVGKFRSVGGTR